MGRAEDQATKLVKLPARIASIVGKTIAELGDECDPKNNSQHLHNDEALIFIHDLLEDFEPGIIKLNKGKRLIRR